MKSNTRKTLLKVAIVSTSVLMSVFLTARDITSVNRNAISSQLKQPTFEIIQKDDNGEEVDKEYFKSKYSSISELVKDGKNLIERMASEGSVLLKNKEYEDHTHALPLAKNSKVTLLGVNSEVPSLGGRGSSHTQYPQDPTDFHEAFEEVGFNVNPKVKATIKDYIGANFMEKGQVNRFKMNEMPFSEISDKADVKASLEEYDTVVYVISRTGGESGDVKVEAPITSLDDTDAKKDKQERKTLNLSRYEKDNLSKLAQLKKEGKVKKVVVLLNATNQIEDADFLEEYDIDATMWIGHIGITGALGVAKILCGDVNPSGSLPDTFFYRHEDNPVMKNFPFNELANMDKYPEFKDAKKLKGTHYTRYYAYQEGVYLGYRYSETRYTDVVEGRANAGDWKYDEIISQPFGAGLSYTTFKYSDFDVVKGNNGFDVKLKVTNTGDVAGKNAVEIYIQKPYTQFDIDRQIEKPAVELAGFTKTGIIEPAASENVTVHIDEEILKTYDRKVDKTYIVTPGDYLFTAAQDSHEAANNFLASKGHTKENNNKMTANGDASLVKTFKDVEYDKVKFSKSEATNKGITNLFDNEDINTYAHKDDAAKGITNSLEFLSRNNWSKELSNVISATQGMVDDMLRQLNSDWIEKGEGSYPTYGASNGLNLINLLRDDEGKLIDYDDPIWDTFLDQLTWEDTVELVRFGYRGTNGLPALGKPNTNDHNGPTGLTEYYDTFDNGLASKKQDPDRHIAPVYYPSVPVIAATMNKQIAADWGDMLGEDALWAGYSGFYGIGLNSHRSPYSGRQFEYWSEDPLLAGQMAAEQVIKLQSHGCNAYIKHFALNDQETQRNNVQIWSNEQALREISLRPFEIAVVKGGAMNAMTSFTRIGVDMIPGSKALVTDFLRGELGMKGVVVTDMYGIGYKGEMLPSFIMAGTDIPDSDKLGPEVFEDYKTGYPALAHAMRQAAHRILFHTVRSNAMNGFDSNTIVRQITPQWEKALIGVEATSITLFTLSMIWGAIELGFFIKKKYLTK